jgi:predicted regulator of Ras-like GTPase activity (Roadblock/LC7/MglB family)
MKINIENVLKEIHYTPGVRGSFVIGRDGTLKGSYLSPDQPAKETAATISSLAREIEGATGRLESGKAMAIYLFGRDGNLVFVTSGKMILAVLTERDANVGIIRHTLRDGFKRFLREEEKGILE